MKSFSFALAIPFVAGALGACSHAHPDLAEPSPTFEGDPGGSGGVTIGGAGGPQPDFGTVVQAADPPPAISGGTLVMASDKNTAVAADPDRDRVYIVDLAERAVLFTVQLPKHSEPGRVTIDASGHAWVVLRRSGGVATIDLATGQFTIQDVCLAPRGIAWDARHSAVQVACANGELVSILQTGTLSRRSLDRDLRDVIVQPDGSLLVTTFRTASTVRVWDQGAPLSVPGNDGANLAWRSVPIPQPNNQPCTQDDCGDSTAVVVQQPTPDPVRTDPGGYGGGGGGSFDVESSACGPATGIITTKVKYGGGSINLPQAVLPVDMATNGTELAVIAAGNAYTKVLPQIFVVFATAVRGSDGGCIPTVHGNVPGQAIAAAFNPSDDSLVVQTREPAALHIMSDDRRRVLKTIPLAADSVADTGHAIFHSNAGGFIACASCHAEGADDGHVWTFVGAGPRRTPSLLATVKGTEPFHWDGDMKDMRDLVDHVFVGRMSGPKVDDPQLGTLSSWIYALPELPKLRAESADTAPGAALFQERCTACHAGAMLTNNRTVDVGTGGAFQVPSLVGVAWRSGFLHTGCAHTLTDRFNPECGGAQHGNTQDLSSDQVQSIVKFLETF